MSDAWDEYDKATKKHKQEGSVKKDPEPIIKTEIKEVIKEVPIEKEVIKEVIKEVPIEKEVIKEVPVEKVVIKEVPKIVEKEVIKEVKVPVYPKDQTKVTIKEFELGKMLMWLSGGLVALIVFFGAKWINGQSFMQKPKVIKEVVYKKTPPKTVVKYKTKWKSDKKEVRRLKENLATAYKRIEILTAQINTPRPVTCRYQHKLKVIHSRN